MAKCEICGKTIENTFLKKLIGTVVKDQKGKRHAVCNQCQHAVQNDKEEMLQRMK